MLNIHFKGINTLKSVFSKMSDVGQKSSFIHSEKENLNISLVPLLPNPSKSNIFLTNGTNCNPNQNDTLIGIQRHRLNSSSKSNNILFLGDLKADLSLLEIYTRVSTHVYIDLNILKRAELPECKDAKPSGLTTEELAQIARYLGYSNTIEEITISNIDDSLLQKEHTIEILSEFLWYLSEGYKNRLKEDPLNNEYAATQYLQHSDFTSSIILYKSKKSQRCWVQLENKEGLIPCSIEEQKMLLQNEIPKRLWELLMI